jgi:hypothetical protein
MLYNSLRCLNYPETVRTSGLYLPMLSTILWQLWIHYFNHGNDAAYPVSEETIEKIVSPILQVVSPNIPFD